MLARNRLFSTHLHGKNCFLLALLIFVLYGKVTGHEFLINWDDVDYITANEDIRGFTLQNLQNIFTKSYAGNYAPVNLLSFMVDYAIWGLHPGAFKITNVLLHVGCTLLLYRLLVRLEFSAGQALLAAALFAVHPVQVESIAWASQRKTPLSLLFFLASWYAWDVWNRQEARCLNRWYLGSLVLFALALLAKSVALVLPVVLLWQELFLNRKSFGRRTLLPLLPYLALTGVCFVLAYATQKGTAGGIVAYHGGSFALTMMNMLPVFVRYLAHLVYPVGLTFIYNAPIKTTPDLTIVASGLLVLLFVGGWFMLRKPYPRLFFWLSLYLIGLLPCANLVPIVTMMNDRYLYYPLVGLAPFAVLLLQELLDRGKQAFLPLPALGAALVIALLCGVSWQQIDVWKNSLTLWGDAMVKAKPGTWYESQKNTNFIREGYVESLVVQATRAKTAGNLLEAEQYSKMALDNDPQNYHALGLLAQAYLQDQQPLLARPYLLQLVEQYPRSDAAHALLGLSYAMTNERQRAAEHYRMALEINPQHATAAENLRKLLHPEP